MEGGTDITSVTFRGRRQRRTTSNGGGRGGNGLRTGGRNKINRWGRKKWRGTPLPLKGKRRRPRGGKSFSGFEKSLLKGSAGGKEGGGFEMKRGKAGEGTQTRLHFLFFSREA